MIALLVYVVVLYGLAWRAWYQVQSVDDFVLAGRKLSLPIATLTLVATWFGAESMMTVANEVAASGIRQAMMDPIGIAICLLLAGSLIARSLWRMNLLTLSDFFRQRYGAAAEQLSAWILIPSYFGWIATQLMALALVLSTLFAWNFHVCIVMIAVVGTGYCLLGGMLSVSWIDTFQMILIAIGLVLLGAAVIAELGGESWRLGIIRLWSKAPPGHWSFLHGANRAQGLSMALGAIAIGAIGNLPTQDLLQRILAAKNEQVAMRACWLAAAGYLAVGALPVMIGMGAACLRSDPLPAESDVMMSMAERFLSYPMQIVFLLAIASAVLSTFSSAVLSPAAMLAENLVGPWIQRRWKESWNERKRLRLQRWAVVAIAGFSVALSLAGRSAYELLQASYAVCFVSLTVPFFVGLFASKTSQLAAVIAMLGGLANWMGHFAVDWTWFLQPWLEHRCPVGQEIASLAISGALYAIVRSAETMNNRRTKAE